MADHVMRGGGVRILHALLGILVGAVVAVAVVAAAVASFGLNPVGPVFVAPAAMVAGGLALRRAHEPLVRGAAVGLLVGGLIAILLWPLFSTDTGGGIESAASG